MYEEMLDQFLDENSPTSEMPTAAVLAHFHLKALVLPETDETRNAMDSMYEQVMPDRVEEAAAGKEEIENASGSELVRIMRRKVDPLNQYAIVKRAMELESEVVPDVLRRFKNNRMDGFIEVATLVLGKSKIDIAGDIIGFYDEMQNPYAQSMALLLLGFKADEDKIPWLISKYHELKKQYPREEFHEGAWYGLSEMHGRFYGT